MRAQGKNIDRERGVGERVNRHVAARLASVVAVLILACGAWPAVGGATASPGQLYAFGNNGDGQLGRETNLGTVNPNSTPTLVSLPGEVGTTGQVATGGDFSLAVTSGGQLYAFGEDLAGELGYRPKNGEPDVNPTPRLVGLPGQTGPVSQVAAGAKFSLAVTSSGQLYAFGNNFFGQLGNATNSLTEHPNTTPTLVTLPKASGPVIQVAAGAFHSLAVTSTGQLYAFGNNGKGQVGTENGARDRQIIPTPTLVTLPGASGRVTGVAGGGFHSLAVTSTGQLYAFGDNHYGQLGSTTLEPRPMPAIVTLPGEVGPVIQVAAGNHHSLALTATGQLYSFGYDHEGQLGIPPDEAIPHPTPTLVRLPGASGRIIRIAAGNGYSLALTSTGELYAFGEDSFGELGTAPGENRGAPHPTPARVPLPSNAETMATGSWAQQTLVVLADLTIPTSLLPGGERGAPYSAQAQATGGSPPFRWSASGLPVGLSINRTTGALSGTPAAGGTYKPTLTVTDSYGIEAPATLTLAVQPLSSTSNQTARRTAISRTSTLAAPSDPPQTPSPHADTPSPGPKRPATTRTTSLRSAITITSAKSPSTWIVHGYQGHITQASGKALKQPAGLAFDAKGDLFVTNADLEERGSVNRYGPSNELECQVGGGFPFGQVESVAVVDESGDVYVAEDFLAAASVWLLRPEGGCYQTPAGVDYESLVSLAADNGPGPHHGDVFAIATRPPYGDPVPHDIKVNSKGELEGSGSELPEPPDEFSRGGESNTTGIAVNATSGTIYLANPQNEEIDIYSKDGALQARTLTTGEPFKPVAVAVDPTTGEVYAIDAERHVVDEFNSAGEFVGEITGASTPAGRFIEPRSVAVKPSTHEVYVSDEGAHAIDIFGADEEEPPPAQPTTDGASEVSATGATLNGTVERSEGERLSWFFRYARGSACTSGEITKRTELASGEKGLLHEHTKVSELEPSTEYSACFSDEGAEGVLNMGSASHFVTSGLAPEGSPVSVAQVNPTGAVVAASLNPQNQLTNYRFEYATNPSFAGAAVAGEGSFAKGIYPAEFVQPAELTGLVPATTYYVRLSADNATGHYTSKGSSFRTLERAPPGVDSLAATEGETVSQARLEGDVSPRYQTTTCAFQYTPEADYAVNAFARATEIPCTLSPFGSATTGITEAVTATASGLQAGVTYYYRLIAKNTTGTAEGPILPATATFTTIGPPNPTTGPAEELAQHSATLTGAVNSDRLATTYHFEFASEAAYTQAEKEGKQDPYSDGHSTADAQASLGASREPLPATTIAGLDAATTYHYRLVATNEAGTRYGQDRTLTTAAEAPTLSTEATTTPPSQPAAPTPPPSSEPPLPPVVQHARQSASRWRAANLASRRRAPTGTNFSFLLNEQATVRFSFIEIPERSRTAHECRARRVRHASCQRTAAAGALTFSGHSGANDVRFMGRVSRTDKLKPGRYELVITATNSAGQRSIPVSLKFTIVR